MQKNLTSTSANNGFNCLQQISFIALYTCSSGTSATITATPLNKHRIKLVKITNNLLNKPFNNPIATSLGKFNISTTLRISISPLRCLTI